MRFTALAVLAVLVVAGCGGTAKPPAAVPGSSVSDEVAAASRLCEPGEGTSLDQTQVCLERRLLAAVSGAGGAAAALPQVDAAAKQAGGVLADRCHLLMHWVGRTYAIEHHVTLASLQSYLPRTNDPGCSAGFAHGLISALGPALRGSDPKAAARVCDRSPTRYQLYSCVHGLGHAYMRAYFEALPLALRLCSQLPERDVVDCSQGAFHDYWFAEGRVDGIHPAGAAKTPRQLCGAQAARFVRACWYRAFLESPPDRPLDNASQLRSVCSGLAGLQLEGCITGAATVVASTDPARQLDGCARLGALALACARGTAVHDLLGAPLPAKVALVAHCDGFGGTREACVEWIAKSLNVVTDGTFLARGCPQVAPADRAACRRGAASFRGALETFS